MTVIVSLAVLLVMISVALFLIRALNERHDQRIAAFRYSDLLPYRRRTAAPQQETAGDFSRLPDGPVRGEPRGPRSGSRRSHTAGPAAGARRPARLSASSGRVTVPERPSRTARADRSEPPPTALADVRVIAASPEAARRVAETLRRHFAGTEQRSYPAGTEGGTRLHLTVDTTRSPRPVRSFQYGVGKGHAAPTGRPSAQETSPPTPADGDHSGGAEEAGERAKTGRAGRSPS